MCPRVELWERDAASPVELYVGDWHCVPQSGDTIEVRSPRGLVERWLVMGVKHICDVDDMGDYVRIEVRPA